MFKWIWVGYFSELSGLSASLPWAGQFGCISCLGSSGVSMGWLVYVFHRTVCVWVFCRESVYWWLWVFQLSGWHTCIYFWIKGLLIMYTWHLNQQFPRILTLHLHNKMRLNVNLHFVTLFMLLIHWVARIDMANVLAFFRDHTLAPTPHSHHISFLYQAYWFH